MTAASPAFPDLVRRCRQERGESQRAFARQFADLGQPQVSKWETGENHLPRPEHIAQLAALCRTTPGAVLAATGYADPPITLAADPHAGNARQLATLNRLAARLDGAQLRAVLAVVRAMRPS